MLTNSKMALSVALVLATASLAVAAPKLNTHKIADDLLGPAQRVYYQDLPTHAKHLKIDKLGAGDFIFGGDSGFPGSNPTHSYEKMGLLISVDRPPNVTNAIGSWGAVNGQNIPQRFVLTGTFIEPKKVSLIPNQPPPQGTYASALLLSFGSTVTGATSQFRVIVDSR
jgi:hypothetical protein